MARYDLSRRAAIVLLLLVLLLHQTVHEWHQFSCGALEQWVMMGSSRNDGESHPILVDNNNLTLALFQQVPMQPLRPLCLEIVQNATPMSLSFVDVSGNNHSQQQHPHMGAVDANGTSGYVHDVTAMTRHPPRFPASLLNVSEVCQLDDEFKLFQERVFVDRDYESRNAADPQTQQQHRRRPKILCMVYTTSAGHARVQMIRETWG